MKKIPTDAFDFYFSIGPARSYQAVADRYDVSKRAVTNLAKREDWQRRLADIEAKARESSDKQKEQALEAAYERSEGAVRARLGLVLHMAYQRRGPFSRMAELVDEACAIAEGDDRLVARAQLARARTQRWVNDIDASEAALEAALEAAKRAGDVETEAGCARNRAATGPLTTQRESFGVVERPRREAAAGQLIAGPAAGSGAGCLR